MLNAKAVSAAEAKSLFADLIGLPALAIAVSGGPDSVALLWLAARWRRGLKKGPQLHAITIDHRLRRDSAREAQAVRRLARELDVTHQILRWTDRKPSSGLQEAARLVRYRLLAKAARKTGAQYILTAHTLDDQAETVLLRLGRGSGLSGLSAMSRMAPLPIAEEKEMLLVRPLLGLPKSRLLATLRKARLACADDPSNRDPRFARARLRKLMPDLAREGVSAPRLSLFARRLRRAELALDAMVWAAAGRLASRAQAARPAIALDRAGFDLLPDEVALRLLGRTIAVVGDEGPVELGKLEALYESLSRAAESATIRRTLAGAVVTRGNGQVLIERAPPRRHRR